MSKIYEDVKQTTPDEVIDSIRSNDPKRICFSLVEGAYTLDDKRWVQDQCLLLMSHENQYVRQTCATCLGHIARIHGTLDLRRVIPALEFMLHHDPEVYGRGCAEDTLDGISQVWKPIQDPS